LGLSFENQHLATWQKPLLGRCTKMPVRAILVNKKINNNMMKIDKALKLHGRQITNMV